MNNFSEKTVERPQAVTLNGKPLTLLGPELKAGDPAPDFECVDNALQPVRLADTGRCVRIFSVVPSLDTPVCDAQTRRFDQEAAELAGLEVYAVSMDLPFAQKRWCGSSGADRVKLLSDHRLASFGRNWGTLIKELRLEARAIFVVDRENVIRHAQYVRELTDFPDYDAAIAVARRLLAAR